MSTILSANASIEFRFASWDFKSLGIKTIEILTIDYQDEASLIQCLTELTNVVVENKIEFIYVRIPALERLLRKTLQSNGFYLAEISHELEYSLLSNYSKDFKELTLEPLKIEDYKRVEQVRLLARDSFDYSRFHDDVNIIDYQARKRYYYWIDDLLQQNYEGFVVSKNSEILGFHFHQIEGEVANLILTGAKRGKSEISVLLWHSVLKMLQRRGVKSCRTMVSASNLGVINLYNFLGFKTKRVFLGMHKFI